MSSATHALELLRGREKDLARAHTESLAQLSERIAFLGIKRARTDELCTRLGGAIKREETEEELRMALEECKTASLAVEETRVRVSKRFEEWEELKQTVSIANTKLDAILRDIQTAVEWVEDDDDEEEEDDFTLAHHEMLERAYTHEMTEEERKLYATSALGDDTHIVKPIAYAQFKGIYQRMRAIRKETTRNGSFPAPKYDGVMIKKVSELSRKTIKVGLHYEYNTKYADANETRRCIVCACPFEEFWAYVETCPFHIAHMACLVSVENAFHTRSYRHKCPGVWTIGATKCYKTNGSF